MRWPHQDPHLAETHTPPSSHAAPAGDTAITAHGTGVAWARWGCVRGTSQPWSPLLSPLPGDTRCQGHNSEDTAPASPGDSPTLSGFQQGLGRQDPKHSHPLGCPPMSPAWPGPGCPLVSPTWTSHGVSSPCPNLAIPWDVPSRSQPLHPLRVPSCPKPVHALGSSLVSSACPVIAVSPPCPQPGHPLGCPLHVPNLVRPWGDSSCPQPCQALGRPNCDRSPHVLNTAILIVSPTWPSLQASPHVPNLSIPGVAPQCPQPVLFPGVSSPRPSLQLSPTWPCLKVSPACLSPEVSPAWPRRGRPPRAPPQPSPRQ